MSERAPIVVAIDGPAAAGKSTTARRVAQRLGFRHVDSGSLYRAATAARIRLGGEGGAWTESAVLEAAAIVGLAPTDVSFSTTLDGEDAELEIRSAAVTRHVSLVAQMPMVREWVNQQVREAARDHDVVVDGRDMGSVVFPGAAVKIFLIADTWERARRRLLQRHGGEPTSDEIAAEAERIVQRDAADAQQSAPARDAVIIDTTHITQDEQVERIAALVRAAGGR
jgi:cytidylate kinase